MSSIPPSPIPHRRVRFLSAPGFDPAALRALSFGPGHVLCKHCCLKTLRPSLENKSSQLSPLTCVLHAHSFPFVRFELGSCGPEKKCIVNPS
jgi:hypothetical protein